MKHIALLQYVADQLRNYADEMMTDDDILATFAETLDELAIEFETLQADHEPANNEPVLEIN